MPMRAGGTQRILVVLCSFLWAASAGAVPLAVVGHSQDSWESDQAKPFDYSKCEWINSAYYVQVVPAQRVRSVERLRHQAIVSLSDTEAAALIEFPGEVSANTSLAVHFLGDVARRKESVRELALRKHKGSWSMSDQQSLDALKATLESPQITDFKPVLVRALTMEFPGSYSLQYCGETLRLMSWSMKETWPAPRRTALILFVRTHPSDLLLEWSVSESFYDYKGGR